MAHKPHEQILLPPISVQLERRVTHRVAFCLLFLVVAIGPIEATPTLPWLVTVRTIEGRRLVHRQGPIGKARALEVREEIRSDAERIGADEYLYRLSHGWRID